MSSIISSRLPPLNIPRLREPVDVSNLGISPTDRDRVARGELSDRQARVNYETNRISHDPSLSQIEKADRIIRVQGNNGDGTNTIRFQSPAEVAEFAQTQQKQIKSSIDAIDGIRSALTRVEDVRAAVGDERAEAYRINLEDAIASMRRSLERDIGSLHEYFNVSGNVVNERPDGQGYSLGAYAISYEGDAGSVLLRTADYSSPASDQTKSYNLVQVLDGVVRERTDRTRPGSLHDRRA